MHARRGDASNDDQAHLMCRFERGTMGHLFFSRVATGRKMGYAYEINGTKGAIRFDQEDQNSRFSLYWRRDPRVSAAFARS